MINNLLYDTISSPEERDVICAIESSSIAIDKSLLAYNAICEKAEINLREAELRCFEESGDIDDLTMYYTEAKEQTEEKKGGILHSIWENITSFFENIANAIRGKKIPKNGADMPAEEYGKFRAVLNKIKDGFSNVANFFKGLGWWNTIIATLAGIGGIFANKGIKKYKEKHISEKECKETNSVVIDVIEFGKSKIDEIGNKTKADGNVSDETVNSIVAILKKIPSKIKEIWDKLLAWSSTKKDNIKNKIADVKAARADKKDAKEEKSGDNSGGSEQPTEESYYDDYDLFDDDSYYEESANDIYNDLQELFS